MKQTTIFFLKISKKMENTEIDKKTIVSVSGRKGNRKTWTPALKML